MLHFFNQTKRRVRIHFTNMVEALDLAPGSQDTFARDSAPGQPFVATDATTGDRLSVWLPERGDSLAIIRDETFRPVAPGDPAARRSAWVQLKVLTGDLDEVFRMVQSSNDGVLMADLAARAAASGDWPRAALLLRRGLDLSTDITQSLAVAYDLAVTLVTLGDLEGYQALCTRAVAKVDSTSDPSLDNLAAWICVLAPQAGADTALAAVKLAESAVAATTSDSERANVLNTLGAVLYRAGRFDEAIDRLMEGVRYRGGDTLPHDLAFLALAHFQKGQPAEAARWLKQFPAPGVEVPNLGLSLYQVEEIQLLRGEAESRVLYDPVFPVDPFAHQ